MQSNLRIIIMTIHLCILIIRVVLFSTTRKLGIPLEVAHPLIGCYSLMPETAASKYQTNQKYD